MGFKFSSTKAIAVRFSRSRRLEEIPTLKIKDDIILFKEEVKFWGVIFKQKLTWGQHIDYVKKKVRSSLNLLKVISHFDWGADWKSLSKLYFYKVSMQR